MGRNRNPRLVSSCKDSKPCSLIRLLKGHSWRRSQDHKIHARKANLPNYRLKPTSVTRRSLASPLCTKGDKMEFIQHTINWVRGEILESVVFGAFGFITLIISIVFWRFGKTPSAKGMIIPLLVIGLFYFIAGQSIYTEINNVFLNIRRNIKKTL